MTNLVIFFFLSKMEVQDSTYIDKCRICSIRITLLFGKKKKKKKGKIFRVKAKLGWNLERGIEH